MQDLFADQPPQERVIFTPSREAGLARLDAFLPRAGRAYAARRNYDFGPERRENVSALSPWIRRRLVTERETLRATLARHRPAAAEKFIQEVIWRGYFKGWLEQRPSVWRSYRSDLERLDQALERGGALAEDYAAAIGGRTGIDGFDAWMRELVETGYLHNHARMWTASIWIFTLRLPWQLGADFFLTHLLDGDPASNTLSWRWVGGLHTQGKTYQARAANIAKYTEGRFHPGHALAHEAPALEEAEPHPRRPLPLEDPLPEGRFGLLLTEEDVDFEGLDLPRRPEAALGLVGAGAGTLRAQAEPAAAFARSAVEDARSRVQARWGLPMESAAPDDWAAALIEAAEAHRLTAWATPYAPVGPVADRLADARPALEKAGVALVQRLSPYDAAVWPHATAGYFKVKKAIPSILETAAQ